MALRRMSLVALVLMFICCPAFGQNPDGPNVLRKYDKNGDGQIDDDERRAVREKLRQRQNQPGAMTPSGKTETIGNRAVTELEYASSDGRKIPCVLSMPQGSGPFPMLVTIHGGQGNRDLGYIRTMAAPNPLSPTISAFNEQPWAILAISYRAGNGALFGMEHDDVIAGIRFAKTLPKVDAARVGVVGGSHGGHLALVAAEKMGSEFLCVAVGSPWMTDPLVYMTGDPAQPPLALVPQAARDDLMKNGKALWNGLSRGRGMSEQEAKAFLEKNSIEANALKIVVPTLFITSRGDDQAPHALIEPMIRKMQTAGKDVAVYTADKSPHGFYWARTVSAARALRGEKSPEEQQEEKQARQTIIEFFTKQFARADVKLVVSPAPSNTADAKPADPPSSHAAPPGAAETRRVAGSGGMSFERIAGDAQEITRERFTQQLANSPALASRPEIATRIFDKLDTDRSGKLSKAEFDEFSKLRGQAGRGAGNSGAGMRRNPPASPSSPPPESKVPADAVEGRAKPDAASPPQPGRSDSGQSPAATRTEPVRVASGQLVGELRGDVRVFRGIPYAAPPIGDLRWKAPQSPFPWDGIREATAFGQSTTKQYGFRNDQIANRAAAARRGGGAAALSSAGREDDTLAVEDSSESRRISEAMIDYLVAFMHNGKPEIEGKPVWPAFSDTARKAMVFGNHGIASRDFKSR